MVYVFFRGPKDQPIPEIENSPAISGGASRAGEYSPHAPERSASSSPALFGMLRWRETQYWGEIGGLD